jgi:hypothetical protein
MLDFFHLFKRLAAPHHSLWVLTIFVNEKALQAFEMHLLIYLSFVFFFKKRDLFWLSFGGMGPAMARAPHGCITPWQECMCICAFYLGFYIIGFSGQCCFLS